MPSDDSKHMRIALDTLVLPESQQQAKVFECAICLGVAQDAVETPCGHIFCKECVEVSSVKCCPTCRLMFPEGEPKGTALSKKSPAMGRLLGMLRVRCPHSAAAAGDGAGVAGAVAKDGGKKRQKTGSSSSAAAAAAGCEWEGDYGALVSEHLRVCGFAEVKCVCGVTHLRKDTPEHEKVCEGPKVECRICGVEMREKDLEKHMETAAISHVGILEKEVKDMKMRQGVDAEVVLEAIDGDWEAFFSEERKVLVQLKSLNGKDLSGKTPLIELVINKAADGRVKMGLNRREDDEDLDFSGFGYDVYYDLNFRHLNLQLKKGKLERNNFGDACHDWPEDSFAVWEFTEQMEKYRDSDCQSLTILEIRVTEWVPVSWLSTEIARH